MTEPGLWVALHHPPPVGAHLSLSARPRLRSALAGDSAALGSMWPRNSPGSSVSPPRPHGTCWGPAQDPECFGSQLPPKAGKEVQLSPEGACRTSGNCTQHPLPKPRAGGRMGGLCCTLVMHG